MSLKEQRQAVSKLLFRSASILCMTVFGCAIGATCVSIVRGLVRLADEGPIPGIYYLERRVLFLVALSVVSETVTATLALVPRVTVVASSLGCLVCAAALYCLDMFDVVDVPGWGLFATMAVFLFIGSLEKRKQELPENDDPMRGVCAFQVALLTSPTAWASEFGPAMLAIAGLSLGSCLVVIIRLLKRP